MKFKTVKGLLILCFTMFLKSMTPLAISQIPQGIPYQAVARNAQGLPLANDNVMVRFSILSGSVIGNAVYVETHTTTTSALGLFSLNVGLGTATTGAFSNIDWSTNAKFLKVELDTTATGNGFVELGTQQMMSVPYALFALNTDSWRVRGDTTYTDNQVNIGNSSSNGIMTYPTYPLNIMGTSNSNAANKSRVGIARIDNTTGSPALVFHKARGNSFNVLSGVLPGDALGTIGFSGFNGTNFTDPSSARIDAVAVEGFTSGSQGTSIQFKTTAIGSAGVTPVRFEIKSEGSVVFIPLNSPPNNPTLGETYFDNILKKLRVWDGTTWQNCW